MGKVAIITGINGQDGSLLANLLSEMKIYDKIVGIQRRTSTPTDWRLKELGLYNKAEFEACSGDITDPGSIDRIVEKYKPDEFYHLAAQSFVSESWNTPSLTHQINTVGTINCLEALRQYKKDCKFYFAASSEQFGGANRVQILDESSNFYPRSPYGVSKVAGFWSTINYRESFDMFCSNGILFNHESPWRGIEFVSRKITDGVARIKLGLQDKIYLGNLDAYRDWGDARDYVCAMWLILQHNIPDNFVIATGKTRQISTFCKFAFNAVGINNWEDFVGQDKRYMRPADVGYLLGDSSKANRELNWTPKISFYKMVEDMVCEDVRRIENEN